MASRQLQPIQSGALRLVGQIQRPIQGQDDYGVPLTTYEWFADVRFSKIDYRPSEAWNANQVVSQVVSYVVIRYIPGLDATMRLVHLVDGSVSPQQVEYYDIQGIVTDDTGRRAIQLACIKRDAAGFRAGEKTGLLPSGNAANT